MSNISLDGHVIIQESAIIQEAQILKKDSTKAIFNICAQTADVINKNGRYYSFSVLDEAMKKRKNDIERKAFHGELDHPLITGNSQQDQIRQTTVLLKEASHTITEYYWDGNKLMVQLETLPNTENGRSLYGYVLGKKGFGLSMRGMAELEHKNNIKYVKSPLYIVGFDAVANPSHEAAVMNFNSSIQYESVNVLTESSCGVTVCTPDGKCYLASYIDMLIEKQIITFCDRWI